MFSYNETILWGTQWQHPTASVETRPGVFINIVFNIWTEPFYKKNIPQDGQTSFMGKSSWQLVNLPGKRPLMELLVETSERQNTSFCHSNIWHHDRWGINWLCLSIRETVDVYSLFFLKVFFLPFLFLLFLSFWCSDWTFTGLASCSKANEKASSRWAIFAKE